MVKIIFFTALVLFPFGQLFKFGFINLFDVCILFLALVTLFKKPMYPHWYKYFVYFILTCMFSLFANYQFMDIKSLLYLVRLWSYGMVAVYVLNFVKDFKNLELKLIAISIVSAIFGWTQYLLWPDLTSLKHLGWDDHLLRMTGTFLDPTFLGLVLVLGLVIVHDKFPKLIYFLLFSLAFTYSRSSYLIAMSFLAFKKKYASLLFFLLVILLIPKNIGEGTNLIRTVSGSNKITNYQETIEIFKRSPIYGVGFNNLCNAREYYLNDIDTKSHSCSGSDSSILFLLTTTGVIGTIIFINFILQTGALSHRLFFNSLSLVLVHSLFANSLFYPHIMFWLFCLLGLRGEINSQGSR